jgi:hypothetical protein
MPTNASKRDPSARREGPDIPGFSVSPGSACLGGRFLGRQRGVTPRHVAAWVGIGGEGLGPGGATEWIQAGLSAFPDGRTELNYDEVTMPGSEAALCRARRGTNGAHRRRDGNAAVEFVAGLGRRPAGESCLPPSGKPRHLRADGDRPKLGRRDRRLQLLRLSLHASLSLDNRGRQLASASAPAGDRGSGSPGAPQTRRLRSSSACLKARRPDKAGRLEPSIRFP